MRSASHDFQQILILNSDLTRNLQLHSSSVTNIKPVVSDEKLCTQVPVTVPFMMFHEINVK